MKRTIEILRGFSELTITLGVSPESCDPETLRTFRERLQSVARANDLYIRLCLMMQAAVGALLAWLLLTNNEPIVALALTVILAGGVAAAMMFLRALWREKMAIELLVAMSDAFDGDAMRTVAQVCLSRLR